MEKHTCYYCGREGNYYASKYRYDKRQSVRRESIRRTTPDGRGTYGEEIWICFGDNPYTNPCEKLHREVEGERRREDEDRLRKRRAHHKMLAEMKDPALEPIYMGIVKLSDKVSAVDNWLLRQAETLMKMGGQGRYFGEDEPWFYLQEVMMNHHRSSRGGTTRESRLRFEMKRQRMREQQCSPPMSDYFQYKPGY